MMVFVAHLTLALCVGNVGALRGSLAQPTPNTRFMLTLDALPFHGSSAMQMLLRSSQNVATLCSMRAPGDLGIWECEPGKALVNTCDPTFPILRKMTCDPTHPILAKCGYIAKWSAWKKEQLAVMPNCSMAGNNLSLKDEKRWKVNTKLARRERQLRFYSKFWDLSKPILFCKFCSRRRASHPKVLGVSNGILASSAVNVDALPASMVAAGITNVLPARIVMWRPICLANLSRSGGSRSLIKEVESVETTVQNIQRYRDEGVVRYVVVGQDELAWNVSLVAARIQLAFPAIGKMDPSLIMPYVNGIGKLQKHSLEAFGKGHDPLRTCGFDIVSRRCNEYEMKRIFSTASSRKKILEGRYRAAHAFLLNHTR